jgi:zinc transport system substrate-binding protein
MKKIVASIMLLVIVGAGAYAAVHRNVSTISKDASKLQVVASFYTLYDIAQNVGGQYVQVSNMTPAGSEPHDYEPSPQALVQAQSAKVFVYNGGTLEPWASKFLGDYKHVAVKASNGIQLHAVSNATDATMPAQDPHFWLDPVLAQQIVYNIRDGLTTADPAHKDVYAHNADLYVARLKQLDADYKTGLASCQTHTIVTSHEAFGYLAQRYGLTAVAIAGVSPDTEPSAAKLAEISKLVKAQDLHYIFFESLVSPRLADTIAAETGAKTVVFDPLEGLTTSDQNQGKNYITVQHENLQNLRTALACN